MMQRSLKVAVALNLGVGALGNYCLAGQKHKDNLAGLKCIMGTEDAASCASECCEADSKKCGGRTPAPTCASDSYFGSDFASKHTAVPTGTAAEADKVCCKKKATCSQATCAAGYEADTAYSKMLCSSDAASCKQNSFCCKKNVKTCGGQAAGLAAATAATHYIPSGDQQTDAWKNIAVVDANDAKTKCQIKKATCKDTTYTCPAGTKKPPAAAGPIAQVAGASTLKPKEADACASDAASCVSQCCVANTATCGGLVLPSTGTFTSSYFKKTTAALTAITGCDLAKTFTPPAADLGEWDATKKEVTKQKAYAKAWAAKATTAATQKANCCLPRPTCTSHTCPAGKKAKAGLAKGTLCTTSDSCTTDCCQDDVATCGGLAATSTIKCKYGFYNEMDGWDAKTTKAVKDVFNAKGPVSAANASTVCCSPRVPCAIPGTSTPAPPAATTTPAAAALKYSEHKIAVEGSQSSAANMLWLGAGAVVGMGVLMVVQGLRSKKQSTEEVASEDADALLNTVEE